MNAVISCWSCGCGHTLTTLIPLLLGPVLISVPLDAELRPLPCGGGIESILSAAVPALLGLLAVPGFYSSTFRDFNPLSTALVWKLPAPR